MPGLVAVKAPSDAPMPRLSISDNFQNIASNFQIQTSAEGSDGRSAKTASSVPRRPISPSSSKSKPSSDRGSVKLKSALDIARVEELGLENPDLGPFLLKQARDAIASGDGPVKALEYASRAARSFDLCAVEGEPNLDLAMSLHVLAAIYCTLGRFDEAIPVLERAIKVPNLSLGSDHALAAFSGHMQLGDTHSMLGQLDRSIHCYREGLKIQMLALGEMDPRVGETCRYLAEAHVQVMQFDEAENLCKRTLEIHRVHSPRASLEEASDRRLMALICEAVGEYEEALEHLVLASMAMVANGEDVEVASIDVSIGNVYLSLCRFDAAVFSYQKALTVFKSSKGDNHPMVASIFGRLADLYYRTGKLRESKSYCENALRIYARPVPGTTQEEIASGLTEISTIYECVSEPEEAVKLLQKAMRLLEDRSVPQSMIAGMESRVGVMFYLMGQYAEAKDCFERAVGKLRASGERKSAVLGVILNQMALACVQLFKIDEAARLFEEAREILEQQRGQCHEDTIGVYSNLAATYDAMGRVEDAIDVLEFVIKLREEKLGTANPDFEEEKRRLVELLKEAGRARNRKGKSLENLIDHSSFDRGNNSDSRKKKLAARRWSGLGFRNA